MKPIGLFGVALVGLGALLLLGRKRPEEGMPTIVVGPEGEPRATAPSGVEPQAYDWMGNPYPSVEAMQNCISTSKSAEELAYCSIRSWG